jgi:hypothetical protein
MNTRIIKNPAVGFNLNSGASSQGQINQIINKPQKDKLMKNILQISQTTVSATLSRLAMLIVAAASVLMGCSGGPSKGQLAAAINEVIKEKVCFALQDKNAVTWPMQVQRPAGLTAEQPLNPILAAMQAAGYLKITQQSQKRRNGFYTETVTIDVITPTEKAKGWWDPQTGFCVGTKAVAEVQEWTDPSKSPAIQVKYTWHLVDVPSWAKRPEFKNIPGMATPVTDEAILEKTNKGWRAKIALIPTL